jgi:glycyl-tRNA synthetase beta chain
MDEQYLPRHAGDRLPATPLGRVLALADRLDTLAGIFAIGKRPSGNKDPFGARRAALGFIRILIEAGIEVDLKEFLGHALAAQPVAVKDPDAIQTDLFDFIVDRFRGYCLDGQAPDLPKGDVTAEIFEAVRIRRPASPVDFYQRLIAVVRFMALEEAVSLASANKRIANILKTAAATTNQPVDPSIFELSEEHQLFDAVADIAENHQRNLEQRDYATIFAGLAQLKAPIDNYFDAVMVMADDQQQRHNRLSLLRKLRALFLDVADLSCIPAP